MKGLPVGREYLRLFKFFLGVALHLFMIRFLECLNNAFNLHSKLRLKFHDGSTAPIYDRIFSYSVTLFICPLEVVRLMLWGLNSNKIFNDSQGSTIGLRQAHIRPLLWAYTSFWTCVRWHVRSFSTYDFSTFSKFGMSVRK